MNDAALFNRAYQVTLGSKDNPQAFVYGNIGNSAAPLRIQFDLDKNLLGNANTSKMVLYNLSLDRRKSISRGWLVRISAGYQQAVETLFIGNVWQATHQKSGADVLTTLELYDGGAAISYATIQKSYSNNVTLLQIVTDVAKAMALETPLSPDGLTPGAAINVPDQVFPLGFVASGTCRDVLTTLLKPHGLEWSVQNGSLNILPLERAANQTAFVVSKETGMVGIPTITNFKMQFTSLLNPKLIPGALIKLETENDKLAGYYKIRECKVKGDTFDKDWTLTALCNEVEAATVTAQNDVVEALG